MDMNKLSRRDPDEILDVTQLAEVLGVSERTIDRRVARGEWVEPFRMGGKRFWRVGTVLEFQKILAEKALPPWLLAERDKQDVRSN